MSCDLSDVTINFLRSGVKIQPLSVDIQRSRQYRNQFDSVSAEVTADAGDHIESRYTPKEPVTISLHDTVLYYGYARHDCVNHGRTRSNLTISDPRRLLRDGVVDKEWGSVSLKTVAEYILDQTVDPQEVISGIELSDPNLDTEKLQHGNLGGGPDLLADLELHGVENGLREALPLIEGDGNFDFREETPYSALQEVCEIWKVEMYMRPSGELVLGLPNMDATVYPAGLDSDTLRIVEYNIPENPTPLKGVYVKGGTTTVPSDNDSTSVTYSIVENFEKLQTRSYAGFTDIDSSETLVVNARDITKPTTLKETARRTLINTVSRNNAGNIVIDVLASDVPEEWFEGLIPGDLVAILLEKWNCVDARDGVYDIQSVQHDISGEKGWSVTLEVSAAITGFGDIETNFWYFDPTNPNMTEDGGAP